jgi:hypothetical protein
VALGFGARLSVATPCPGGAGVGSTATGAGVGERSAKATSAAGWLALTNMVGPMIARSSAPRSGSGVGRMSGTRTAALVCGTAREGPLGAGPLSAGEVSAVGGTSAAAAVTVGAEAGEVLLAAVVPVVWGLLPSAPPAVVPAPAVAEVLGPSLPVFVLSEALAPVVPVVAVPVVCEPLSALDVVPSELAPLVVVVLLVSLAVVVVVLLVLVCVCVCVVPVSVPAGDAGPAVAEPGVGGTVVAIASAATGGSLTGPDGSSPVTAVTAVAAVVAADVVADAV